MEEMFDWFCGPDNDRRRLSQPRFFAGGRPRIAVAYVRSAVRSTEALALQRAALQRWSDGAGYHIVRWYVEGDGVGGDDSELARLLLDAALDGRDFDYVVVRDYARVSRRVRVLVEVMEGLSDLGVELVAVT